LMFSTVDAIIISKMDYLPLSDFDIEKFTRAVTGMNHQVRLFPLSARTGEGMAAWIAWLESLLKDA